MRSLWKVLLALALLLPMAAFVAGTLVASSANEPRPRQTIVIEDTSGSTSAEPTDAGQPQKGDDDGNVEEVSPSPEEIGDDADGSGDDQGEEDGDGSGAGFQAGSSGDGGGRAGAGGGGDDQG